MSKMEDSLRELMKKPLSSLPTFIDIGRLSKRIDVFIREESDEGIEEEISSVIKNRNSASLTKSHAHYLAKVLRQVAIYLEPEDQRDKILAAIDNFEKNAGDELDLQNHVRELFSAAFEENCRTVMVFKMINQAALSLAVTALKIGVTSSTSTLGPDIRMTKDVRTQDGWRILIKITPSEICISHIRKEQTLGKPICPDYWDVKWKLDLHYPLSMEDLKYADISVVEMTFGPDIPADMKTELERVYKSFDVHATAPLPALPTPGSVPVRSASTSSDGGRKKCIVM